MGVKLASSLPDDDRRNGMDVLFPALVREPEGRHVVVLVVDCAYTKVTHTPDGPLYAPAAGIIHAEPITDGRARDEILHHLAAHRAERQGEQELDLDFGFSDPVNDLFRDAAQNVQRIHFTNVEENEDA